MISISTPDGNCSRISASTVFDVGSRMSMRRLCVRISNCSWGVLIDVGGADHAELLDPRRQRHGAGTAAPVRSAASTICTADWSRIRWSKAFSRIRIFWRAIDCLRTACPACPPRGKRCRRDHPEPCRRAGAPLPYSLIPVPYWAIFPNPCPLFPVPWRVVMDAARLPAL